MALVDAIDVEKQKQQQRYSAKKIMAENFIFGLYVCIVTISVEYS